MDCSAWDTAPGTQKGSERARAALDELVTQFFSHQQLPGDICLTFHAGVRAAVHFVGNAAITSECSVAVFRKAIVSR